MKKSVVFILMIAMLFQVAGCKKAVTGIEVSNTPEAVLQGTPDATNEAQESINPTALPQATEAVTENPTEKATEKPQKTEAPKTPEANTCSLKIDCSSIFDNIEEFDEKKLVLLPDDGIIYSNSKAEFNEGETVFDVLKRELQNQKIHFDYSSSVIGNNVYIEGINNIYELDCGGMSGWLYSVNGEYPESPCSQYVVSAGDRIEILYTCDMGEDARQTV